MNKKVLTVICVLVVVVIIGVVIFLAVKGNNEVGNIDNVNENAVPQESVSLPAYTLEYEGKNITPGTEFSKAISSEEPKYSEIPSCAFDGVDKVYNYDAFEIITSDIKGKETIYSVELLNDSISTKQGLKIADDENQVTTSYGGNYEKNGNEYIYSDGSVKVSIIVENDTVTRITYTMITQ